MRLDSLAVIGFAAALAACSTPQNVTYAQLESRGVRVGSKHWDATHELQLEGYLCNVSGAKREHFDCTKTAGFLPTCLLRVTFEVDESNFIASLGILPPACIGTP